MYDILISNKNASTGKYEAELLFSTIYTAEDYSVLSPVLEKSIDKADSLSFVVLPNHRLYDKLNQLRTLVTVEKEGVEIFRGRVLSVSKDFYNQKTVQCEGDISFLSDSVVRPVTSNSTLQTWFNWCIDRHNENVTDVQKFEKGDVKIAGATTVKMQLEYTDYSSTKSFIDTYLIENYGGYLRTRTKNGKRYIDWIPGYDHESKQTIEFGVNLLEITREDQSYDDIFTRVIPLGNQASNSDSNSPLTISAINNKLNYVEVPGAVAKYGVVYRVVNFDVTKADDDKDNTAERALKTNAQRYINLNYFDQPTGLTVRAVDMSQIDGVTEGISLGDKVRVVSVPNSIDSQYNCIGITYDLLNPGEVTYSFGRHKQNMTKRYLEIQKKTDEKIAMANETAKTAKKAAKKAQDTANSAWDTAEFAAGEADKAKTTAQSAATTASDALSKAKDAIQKANDAKDATRHMSYSGNTTYFDGNVSCDKVIVDGWSFTPTNMNIGGKTVVILSNGGKIDW